MERPYRPDFSILVAGHIVVDEIIDNPYQTSPRRALGGPISYSSLSLKSLGYHPEIVTHVGDDFPKEYSELLKRESGVDVSKWISHGFKTTSYKIDRSGVQRKMWLSSRCQELSFSDFSDFLSSQSNLKSLIVNPVVNEVALTLLERISKEFDSVFVDSQGFVRRFVKETGEVKMRSGLDISALSGVDFLKTDLQELEAWVGTKSKESALRQLGKFVETILLTSGPRAIEVYQEGTLKFRALPFRVDVSDTTGAGDILLSTFAGRISEVGDIAESLKFAIAASTLAVRNIGVEKAILSKEEVLRNAEDVEIRENA